MCEVKIEVLLELFKTLKEIDRKDFKDIVWTYEGKVLDLNEDYQKNFKFIGLNNTSFVQFGLWEEVFETAN